MLYLVFMLTFGAVALGSWAVLRPDTGDAVTRRLRPDGSPKLTHETRLEQSLVSRTVAPGIARVGHAAANLLPQNMVASISQMLVRANEPMALGTFLVLWMLSAVAGVALIIYVGAVGSISATQMFGMGVLIVPFFALAPWVWLRGKARRRIRAITRSLPDALDLLVTSVEAGMGVDAAFGMVTEKTTGPLSETFSRYLRDVGLGRSRRDALADTADRSGVPELMALAASVSQSEELGTTLGDALRNQAEDVRIARRQRVEQAAQRAPVLMTIPLALCFLPAMVAVIIVPSILNLVDFVSTLGD